MQTRNPTTEMATAAAVEADVEAVTKSGVNSPCLNSSSDSDASDHFFQEDPVYDTSGEDSEPSIFESPYASDSDSATITLSRQQLGQRNGRGSADSKIPDSGVGSAMIKNASRSSYGSYVFGGCMIVSYLLVLSSPLLLDHLYSEPPALLSTIAAFISACIIFLIFIVSPTMCLSTFFFHMPWPLLLAIAADRFVGPCGGFLVMHMLTGWLAGVLGYAYAGRLQHIVRETTAKLISPSTFLKEEDERSFKMDRVGTAAGFGFISLLLATAGAVALWLFPMEGFPITMMFLSLLEGFAVFSWVAFVARFVLHDALLSADQLGYIILYCICPYLVVSFFLLVLVIPFGWTGFTIGAVSFWCLVLFIAGLLGYELSVHAQCKQMILSR